MSISWFVFNLHLAGLKTIRATAVEHQYVISLLESSAFSLKHLVLKELDGDPFGFAIETKLPSECVFSVTKESRSADKSYEDMLDLVLVGIDPVVESVLQDKVSESTCIQVVHT